METPSQILEALSRFAGQKALVVENGPGSYLAEIALHFEQVDAVTLSSDARLHPLNASTPSNVTRAMWSSEGFPGSEGSCDTVFLLRVLSGSSDGKAVLRESLRLLKQHGKLVVLETNHTAGTEQQSATLDLERLMRDRDAVLREQPPSHLTMDEIRAELRTADLHHLRVLEVKSDSFRLDSYGRESLKREALDRLKLDLLPSLNRLGSRRNEFERRLIDLKRRIEINGIAPLGLILMHGLKKTVYASSDTSLFAGEIFAPEAGTMRFELRDDDIAPTDTIGVRHDNVEGMDTPQLLSLIMTGGESGSRLERLGKRILSEYGSRAVADERNPEALVETLGIGANRASQIVAAFELGRRFFASADDDSPVLRGPEDIFRYVSDMAKLRREQFRGLYLNNRNRLVADEVIAIGTLTSAILHPREVFRPALTRHAVSVIVVHNHPSGDPEPSSEDVDLTRQLHQAGQILGIELLDHVVVGGDRWFSMREADLF